MSKNQKIFTLVMASCGGISGGILEHSFSIGVIEFCAVFTIFVLMAITAETL